MRRTAVLILLFVSMVPGLFAQNRFTVKGRLLLCDVDAARASLRPGGTQSRTHYRQWNWCLGFVDGVIETLELKEGCSIGIVDNIPVIELAQKLMITADKAGPDAEKALQGLGGFPPAKAVARALFLLQDSPEWVCDEGSE